MPSRRRHRSGQPSTSPAVSPGAGTSGSSPSVDAAVDPAEQFAAALRESEARDKAARQREAAARAERDRSAKDEADRRQALDDAKRELERRIAEVREAKASGAGTAEADGAWKAAKARVIELETGSPPSWASPQAEEEAGTEAIPDVGAEVEPE